MTLLSIFILFYFILTSLCTLGSVIGGSVAHNRQQQSHYQQNHFVELLIQVENGDQFMVVQDQDQSMRFSKGDNVRLVYLNDNTVRVDKAY